MRRPSNVVHLIVCFAAILPFTPVLHAGPALDEIVAPMKLDQRSADPFPNQWRDVQPDKPLGQTFITSPSARRLCRIAVSVPGRHESWTPDESLTLTLYDSSEKKVRITSYAMPYKWRRWEGGIMMFPLWCPIQPSRSYYFELTVTGGDGLIRGIRLASKPYSNGNAYIAGDKQAFSLFFETHTKSDLNPDADYGRLFSLWNLDYPGLEQVKTLVARKEWQAASYALVDYYENHRPDIMQRVKIPATRPANFDPTRADLAIAMKVLTEQEGQVDIGPDWNHYAEWPTRGGVGLTREGIRKFIAHARLFTADPKYAKAWNDINLACFRDQPNPVEAGVFPKSGPLPAAPAPGIAGGSMWASLSIAARAATCFTYYRYFIDSPEFTPDARTAFIFDLADMANVLSRHQAGGNWTTQIKSALITLAEQHPEWRNADAMMADGLAGMIDNVLETIHPDGPLKEATINYHLFTLGYFSRLLETADRLKVPFPDEARQRILKAAEYAAFSAMPDLTSPLFGDANPVTKPAGAVSRPAEMFHRDDLLYFASERASGSAPTFTSIAFPAGGYYFMRSDWSADARYLAIHNGHSTSHGHNDALAIIVAAHGRQLVIDPGVYIYGTPDCTRLARTVSHSTVTVNNRDTQNANGQKTWLSSPTWDYFSGTNAGYIGANQTRHRRQIIFAKPDYWVIHDTLLGPIDGPVTSRFVFADTQARQDAHVVRTTDPNRANLAIIPADPGTKAALVPMKRAASWESLADCSVAQFTPATNSWSTVLLPLEPSKQPDAKVEILNGTPGHALAVTRAQSTDLFIFQDPNSEGAYNDGQVKFTGESALFCRQGDTQRTLTAKSCRSFEYAGQELFFSKQPADIDIRWSGRQLVITAPSGSRVHSTGITSALINGANAQISGKADDLVVP
jgi:heparan-sulfate lyase